MKNLKIKCVFGLNGNSLCVPRSFYCCPLISYRMRKSEDWGLQFRRMVHDICGRVFGVDTWIKKLIALCLRKVRGLCSVMC